LSDDTPTYLTVPDVLEIHAQVMESMNSYSAPLRSMDLLESAVMRPQAVAHYGGADLAEQAVTLAVGISQNQPFLDGNKRTAFASMQVFLEINGYKIDADDLDIAKQLIAVAEREDSLEAATTRFAAWVRERMVEFTP
jgi:death-on-curing protein